MKTRVADAAWRWARGYEADPCRVLPSRIRSGIALPVQSHGIAHVVKEAAVITDGADARLAATWLCGYGSGSVMPLAGVGDLRLCNACQMAQEFGGRRIGVYRTYDADGAPVYIGSSINVSQRLASHRSQSAWWHEVVVVEVDPYDSEIEARRAELIAIASENPRYNVRGRTA